MRKIILCVLTCVLLCSCAKTTEHTRDIFAMDTVMNLKVYSTDDKAIKAAEEEINRLDAFLDRGNEESEIYKLNAEKSAAVSEETAEIISKALSVSALTEGAFDITIAPVMDLWGFYSKEYHVPTDEELNAVLDGVGYEKIQLDGNHVVLPENTSIDLGGIGKGYTSDRVAEILKSNGVSSAIISLGGNVHALGAKPSGEKWTVGIADPENSSSIIGKVKVRDRAVITSGGYQRFFEQDGKTYHHIIDPATGKSSESGLLSVTVISESGIRADGLSTALFVMGIDRAAQLWREGDDFEAVFVGDDGTITITDGIENDFESEHDYSVLER